MARDSSLGEEKGGKGMNTSACVTFQWLLLLKRVNNNMSHLDLKSTLDASTAKLQ